MNKHIYIISFFTLTTILFGCESRTYEEISDNKTITATVKYNDHVKPIIQNNCVNCHSAYGDASFYPITNYTETKSAISNIIDRIQRANGDPLKMPQGGSLSQSNIELIKKWQSDGLLE